MWLHCIKLLIGVPEKINAFEIAEAAWPSEDIIETSKSSRMKPSVLRNPVRKHESGKRQRPAPRHRVKDEGPKWQMVGKSQGGDAELIERARKGQL